MLYWLGAANISIKEKMGWLDIDPASIRHILLTHQDTDHIGAVETDSFARRVPDPEAPFDGYDEREDTEEKARSLLLPKKRG